MADFRNALPVGYRLNEYVMEAVLGQGGFGVTYLAQDTQLEQKVAIKEYLPADAAVREDTSIVPKSSADVETYKWGLDRFLMEARTLARFRHKNIVRVQRFFEANGTAYAVMEYEDGDSLSSMLKSKGGVLGEKELKELLFPLLDGMRLIHSEGFIHRDIKPGNIFIRRDGSPVLIDFGSARHTVVGRELTTIATPGYAPFEQYFSDGNQGPWSDIYAMGGVIYRSITGKAPPDAASRLKKDPMVSLVQLAGAHYSRSFLEAADWALTMDEEKRPQNVDEWMVALGRPAEGGAGSAAAAGSAPTPAAAVKSGAAAAASDEPISEKTSGRRDSKASWGTRDAEEKPAAGGGAKLAVVAGVVLMAALGGGYAFLGGKADETKALQQAEVQAPTASTAAPAAKAVPAEVAELVAMADADLAAGRLDAPKDANAMDRYLQALQLDPENPAAKAGLARISDRYIDLAEQVAEKDINKAKNYIDRAAAIRGEANVKEARTWLADLQRLHGGGK